MKQVEKEVLNTFFEDIPTDGDVLLLASPLVWTGTPLLNLHLLQAACRLAGIPTRVLYPNLLFSIITGGVLHSRISLEEYLFLEERLFASVLFKGSTLVEAVKEFAKSSRMPDYSWEIKADMSYLQVPEVLAPFGEWIGTVDWEHLESLTKRWVQSTAQRIANMGYRVVGCSTTFGGLVPAVALLDNIKRANNKIITVLGGVLCEGEMAEGILSLRAGIDYVFSGEGELTFPDFVKKVLAGHLPGTKIISGEAVTDLDIIPPPDYRDYFRQLQKLPQDHPSSERFGIPYETSRGCWYGRCIFCTLNEKNNFYREKSPPKILDDLKEIITRHGISTVFMTDSIMPRHYFDTLLPQIAKTLPSLRIRHDVKSNLTLDQVLALKKAGVMTIIPGIESLSSSLLRRMRKGVTVRENIALLRYARSVHLELNWFLLFGFPGDEAGEYEEMVHLLPLIRHLPPPRRMFPLIIYRFSQYQRFPELFDISNLRPAKMYRDVFPFSADLEKIAFYFSGNFKTQAHENPEIIVALAREFRVWKKAWAAYEVASLEMMLPALHITRKREDEYILEDTRGLPGSPKQMVLDREQTGILLVPRPQGASVDFQWAVDARLGVVKDGWFIPLATAEPELLQEFEREYEAGNQQ